MIINGAKIDMIRVNARKMSKKNPGYKMVQNVQSMKYV